jgi:small subunit ribosomal protein S16
LFKANGRTRSLFAKPTPTICKGAPCGYPGTLAVIVSRLGARSNRTLAEGCDILERLWVNNIPHAHYLLDSFNMIKLRLKKFGKKREASYRIVAAQSTTRRDGRPLEELGFYNPRTDEVRLNTEAIVKRLQQGAQPTETVRRILEKAKVYEQLGT